MGDLMRKQIIFVVAILAVVVFASGCTTSGNSTKTYNDSGISFSYPDNWQKLGNVTNAQNLVVAFGDPDSMNSSTNLANTFVFVQKIQLPAGYTLKQAQDAVFAMVKTSDPNFQKISNRTITVNGLTGYEVTYKENAGGVQKQEVSAWFAKNGYIYVVTGSTLPSEFNNQKAKFDAIINSFQLQ